MSPEEIKKLRDDYFSGEDRGEYQPKREEINIGPWSTQEEIDAKNAQIASRGSANPSGADVAGNTFWILVYGAPLAYFAWAIISEI
jgi:hypothetical protein